MRKSFYTYCVEQNLSRLLLSWDAEKNAPLTPQDLSFGSNRLAWWICGQGHSWQASVSSRTLGRGCPYCAGRRVWPGGTDLAAQHPQLAAQWHPTKNGTLTPELCSPGSHKRVWWRCEKGHSWQAEIKSRSAGTGCPYCANRQVIPGENDLATTHPFLAVQWDAPRNVPLTPAELPAGSTRRVWWRCEKGHSWRAAVSSRARGSGCPVCAGKSVEAGENDLATCRPEIAAEWHPVKNDHLTPADCTPSSNRRVWWCCPLGHEYQAAVGARTVHGSGCPYCSGKKVFPGFNDLATLEPRVAAQWHPALNGLLTPQDVTAGSCRKVWWQCQDGHAWKAVINSRTGKQKCGCPVCAGKVKAVHSPVYRESLDLTNF